MTENNFSLKNDIMGVTMELRCAQYISITLEFSYLCQINNTLDKIQNLYLENQFSLVYHKMRTQAFTLGCSKVKWHHFSLY